MASRSTIESPGATATTQPAPPLQGTDVDLANPKHNIECTGCGAGARNCTRLRLEVCHGRPLEVCHARLAGGKDLRTCAVGTYAAAASTERPNEVTHLLHLPA